MKCMSETKLVKQCWAILATVRVTSMCNVEKRAGELKAAGVGPTSGQCSLAAAQMSAYRRLPTTCRRRHAAAEMPTAPRLLPTLTVWHAEMRTSGRCRASVGMPLRQSGMPSVGRRWADVGPIYRLDPYIGPSDRVQITRPPPGRNPGHLPAPLPQRIGVYKSSLACFVCLTAGVGPTSGQCSLAAAKMSAYRRLPTTCRRRHAAAEMRTSGRCRASVGMPLRQCRRHPDFCRRRAVLNADLPRLGRCLADVGMPLPRCRAHPDVYRRRADGGMFIGMLFEYQSDL